MKNTSPTLLLVEFQHKTSFIETAQKIGYQTILITEKKEKDLPPLFHKVYTVDFHDSLQIDHICEQIKKNYDLKAVITNYDEFVVQRSYLAEKLELPAPSLYSACCTRNKVMQRHCFNFLKENIPNRLVKSEKSAIRSFHSLGKDVYLKSISGIKSQFISHVKTEKELLEAYQNFQKADLSLTNRLYDDFSFFDLQFHYPDPKKTCLIEKNITGRQISVASFCGSYDITHAPSVCDIYTAGDIGQDDSYLAFRILPSQHDESLIQKAHNLSTMCSRVLGLRHTALHSEFFLTEQNELKIIEVNARIGGYRSFMYRESYDINIEELFLSKLTAHPYEINPKNKNYVSLVELFPRQEGVLKSSPVLEKILTSPEIIWKKQNLFLGQKIGPAKKGFRPILAFLIKGKTYEEVKEKSIAYHEDFHREEEEKNREKGLDKST